VYLSIELITVVESILIAEPILIVEPIPLEEPNPIRHTIPSISIPIHLNFLGINVIPIPIPKNSGIITPLRSTAQVTDGRPRHK